jgi:hypothetical protein|nr:MAG TPA: ASCH domain protein [Caudoviricetes sp.]
MAIKPILFNTEMVRAILDGRKSCTRRLVKFLPGENPRWTGYIKDGLMLYNGKNEPCIRKASYQPGDILYVRETWGEGYEEGTYIYRASDKLAGLPTFKESSKLIYHPSIHMPKEAARIWLKIMNVRVERLQEMKPLDVIKEGAYPDCWDCLNTYGESGSQCCYGTEEQCSQCDEVMMEWEKLWTSTIKKSDLDCYGWDANPWVWVIEFERCEKPKGV